MAVKTVVDAPKKKRGRPRKDPNAPVVSKGTPKTNKKPKLNAKTKAIDSKKLVDSLDKQIEVIKAIGTLVADLSNDQRKRVLRWAQDEFVDYDCGGF